MDVSIIIPVYNASCFIEKCLASVKKQCQNISVECLLIDDCSTDNTLEVIKDFMHSYKGEISFRLFRQKTNNGPSEARNLGVINACGEYVFFLDSDDSLTDNCLSVLFSKAKKYDADYVQGTYFSDEKYHMPAYTSVKDINVSGIYALPEFSDDRRFIKRTMLNYNIIPYTPHNRLVKRSLLMSKKIFFNQKIFVREDFCWMFFLAKEVSSFAVCTIPTYKRGFNDCSLTHKLNVEREILGSKILIEEISRNIDPFMVGSQKVLLLDALLIAINAKLYNDNIERENLIKNVRAQNTVIENILLETYLCFKGLGVANKILHLLIRIYKMKD